MMEADDATLLRRYAFEGSQESFTCFVERHMDLVYSAALRRVGFNDQQAKDVAQDVFILVAKNAISLVGHPAILAWLHAATKNAAVNRVRAEVRRKSRERTYVNQSISNDSGQEADWSEVSPVLDSAIDTLKEAERQALLLRYFHRLTFKEIGTSLRINEDAARLRVDRALGKLRLVLERRGVRSTVAALGGCMLKNTVAGAPAGFAAQVAQSVLGMGVATVRVGAAWSTSQVYALVLAWGVILAVLGFTVQDIYRLKRQRTAMAAHEKTPDLFLPLDIPDKTSSTTTGESKRGSDGMKGVTNDSAVDRFVAGGRKAHVTATHTPLYEKLGLTAEQIAAFETEYVRSPGPGLWMYALQTASPASETLSSVAVPDRTLAERDARLRSVLGDTGFTQYAEYRRSLPARELVVQIAAAVYMTDPLSREKGEALAALLASHCPGYRSGNSVDLHNLSWESALDEAGKLLTERQLKALEAMRRRISFEQAISDSLNADAPPYRIQ